MLLNIKLVRIFSSRAYLGEVEIEKSTITLKYATDAERIFDDFIKLAGAAVVEWLSSRLAEQEFRGSIPGLAT